MKPGYTLNPNETEPRNLNLRVPQRIHYANIQISEIPAVDERALVCLSNREIVDASGGRTVHCKMANTRLRTVVSL